MAAGTIQPVTRSKRRIPGADDTRHGLTGVEDAPSGRFPEWRI
jgi:hypothetical protein